MFRLHTLQEYVAEKRRDFKCCLIQLTSFDIPDATKNSISHKLSNILLRNISTSILKAYLRQTYKLVKFC